MTVVPFNSAGLSLNPDEVVQLCEDRRWSSAGLKNAHLPGNKFGTLVEEFEQAAKNLPEGSEERKAYEEAKDNASKIYRDQILEDIRNETGGMDRAEVENINKKLFDLACEYEGSGTYIRGRLLWAAHMAGEWWQKQNGSVHGRRVGGANYRQFGPKKK